MGPSFAQMQYIATPSNGTKGNPAGGSAVPKLIIPTSETQDRKMAMPNANYN